MLEDKKKFMQQKQNNNQNNSQEDDIIIVNSPFDNQIIIDSPEIPIVKQDEIMENSIEHSQTTIEQSNIDKIENKISNFEPHKENITTNTLTESPVEINITNNEISETKSLNDIEDTSRLENKIDQILLNYVEIKNEKIDSIMDNIKFTKNNEEQLSPTDELKIEEKKIEETKIEENKIEENKIEEKRSPKRSNSNQKSKISPTKESLEVQQKRKEEREKKQSELRQKMLEDKNKFMQQKQNTSQEDEPVILFAKTSETTDKNDTTLIIEPTIKSCQNSAIVSTKLADELLQAIPIETGNVKHLFNEEHVKFMEEAKEIADLPILSTPVNLSLNSNDSSQELNFNYLSPQAIILNEQLSETLKDNQNEEADSKSTESINPLLNSQPVHSSKEKTKQTHTKPNASPPTKESPEAQQKRKEEREKKQSELRQKMLEDKKKFMTNKQTNQNNSKDITDTIFISNASQSKYEVVDCLTNSADQNSNNDELVINTKIAEHKSNADTISTNEMNTGISETRNAENFNYDYQIKGELQNDRKVQDNSSIEHEKKN